MSTAEITPGVPFSATDGNYNPVDDAVIPLEGEATDFVYDADGREVRAGDWVELLPGASVGAWASGWVGEIVYVERITRARLYQTGYMSGTAIRDAWSPSSPSNRLSIVKDGRISTGCSPLSAQKVNLTDEDTARLELRVVNLDLGRLYEAFGELEGKRLMLTRKQHALMAKLGDAE